MKRLSVAGIVLGLVIGGCSSGSSMSEIPSGRLEVSELLYRSGSDSLEWLEIRNAGSAGMDLSGVSVPAVGFVFPAGAGVLGSGKSVVLTNSAALFALRHPGVAIAGTFTGRLSDDGEDLTLEAAGEVLFEGKFSPKDPWPQAAAWAGASLVLTGATPTSASSWSASTLAGGFPGKTKEVAPLRHLEISEVRPADDSANGFVELASHEAVARDLSGWLLTDSVGSPRGLPLPSGTVLPAHGKLVLAQGAREGTTSWGGLWPSRTGGRLLLLERRGDSSFTGWAAVLEWNAIPSGGSFARLAGGGTSVLAVPTPGASDSLAANPMAYVSEVCYHPKTGAEYLELTSLSDTTIHLGHPTDTNLAWKLNGASLRFSVQDTLAPRGRLVLVASKDATPASFRAWAGVPSAVGVVAYEGRLDNAGERLELSRPYYPVTDAAGALGWARQVVDAAQWLPVAPWPASADGEGDCLERIDPRLPGDAVRAWRAAKPTPGH